MQESLLKGKEKSKTEKISDATIRRLSVYYRTLSRMEKQGIQRTTSMELAEIEGLTPVMVRKDLSFFGTFGSRGVGYDITSLKKELAVILGYNRKWGLVIIGGGLFSDVLVNSQILSENNFVINKIFEKNPSLLPSGDGPIKIYPLEDLGKRLNPAEDHIAIIALPPPEVQGVIDRLADIGVKAVIYLASRTIKVPPNMICVNQDIFIKLGMLTYKLREQNK
ncbi:MAG: redox-sensing transcriptional repressor Rex [Thermodesulfobacteriota bacterium]